MAKRYAIFTTLINEMEPGSTGVVDLEDKISRFSSDHKDSTVIQWLQSSAAAPELSSQHAYSKKVCFTRITAIVTYFEGESKERPALTDPPSDGTTSSFA